jgi:hypothetical protein
VDERGRLAPSRLKEAVVLRLPLPPAAAGSAHVDRERETAELLALHALDREAHFRTDVDLLQRHSGETFIAVSRGRIDRISRADERAFFTDYFAGATYQEWDDLEPPIVRVSGGP